MSRSVGLCPAPCNYENTNDRGRSSARRKAPLAVPTQAYTEGACAQGQFVQIFAKLLRGLSGSVSLNAHAPMRWPTLVRVLS